MYCLGISNLLMLNNYSIHLIYLGNLCLQKTGALKLGTHTGEIRAGQIYSGGGLVLYGINKLIFMPPPFEEWWRGIKCYPCPCVRPCVHSSVRASVRYQNLVSAQ